MTTTQRRELRTLTVGQLRDLLADYGDDLPVVFSCDYGDYCHTEQALPIRGHDVFEVVLEESAYSQSGFAVADDDDYDVDEQAPTTYLRIK